MKTQMNKPINSKINWTALVMAIIGVMVALDYIPPEMEEDVITITMIAGPALIGVFRTWYTEVRA